MNVENNQDNLGEVSQKSKVSELSELISVIVDYYCFKGNITDEEEGDEWKKKAGVGHENTIPEKIDGLIEKAFSNQLKRFGQKDGV